MLIRFIVKVLAYAAALLALSAAGIGIGIAGLPTALIVAALWSVIGFTIKPLIQLLALPITLLTFGLFSFVINALLFWLLSILVPGFFVAGFVAALLGSVALAAVAWILHTL